MLADCFCFTFSIFFYFILFLGGRKMQKLKNEKIKNEKLIRPFWEMMAHWLTSLAHG